MHVDDFRARGFVGVAWREVGPVSPSTSDEELAKTFRQNYPDERELTRAIWTSQLRRFLKEMQVGEGVVTYDPGRRQYLIGSIESEPEWWEQDLPHARKVVWTEQALRDHLSAYTRNALGSTASLSRLTTEASRELRRRAVPLFSLDPVHVAAADDSEGRAGEQLLLEETIQKSEEFVEDRLARLTPPQFEELVGGLMRAMGYRTRYLGDGRGGGARLQASPDGLGLQPPRLCVGVTHQPGTPLGGADMRAFLAERRGCEQVIYVSSGGFGREARQEIDKAGAPATLITLPQFRELLVQYYNQLEDGARQLLPLRHVYWPVP